MAFTINEQPTVIGFSRTPILYLVFEDTLYTEDDFEYIADVYLWQDNESKPATPNYQLRKPPSIDTGECIFDTKTLTSDYLVTPEYDITGSGTAEMYVNMQVHFGYSYINDVGEPVLVENLELSNEIIAVNGYNYYMDGINYVPNDNLGIGYSSEYQERVVSDGGTVESIDCLPKELNPSTGSGFWMTDRPTEMCIPDNTSMHLFSYNDSTAGAVKRVYVQVNDGAYTSVFELSAADKIFAVGCGSIEIKAQFLPPDVELVNWEIYGADGDGDIVTQVYSFTLCEPCKYGFRNLQFLNRYGMWDYIIMYGAEHDAIEVERSEILHSPLEIRSGQFYFNKPYGQYHMANIHGRETKTVNTDWIGEEWNEVFKQFMLSVFLSDSDTQEPFTISTTSLRFRTSLNDKLNNYTIELTKGYTSTNSVG